jgi:hypothetical protein
MAIDCIAGLVTYISALAFTRDRSLEKVLGMSVLVGLGYATVLHGMSVKFEVLGRSVSVGLGKWYDRWRRMLAQELCDENFQYIGLLADGLSTDRLFEVASRLIMARLGDGEDAMKFRRESQAWLNQQMRNQKLTDGDRRRALAAFVVENASLKIIDRLLAEPLPQVVGQSLGGPPAG